MALVKTWEPSAQLTPGEADPVRCLQTNRQACGKLRLGIDSLSAIQAPLSLVSHSTLQLLHGIVVASIEVFFHMSCHALRLALCDLGDPISPKGRGAPSDSARADIRVTTLPIYAA